MNPGAVGLKNSVDDGEAQPGAARAVRVSLPETIEQVLLHFGLDARTGIRDGDRYPAGRLRRGHRDPPAGVNFSPLSMRLDITCTIR